MNIKHLVIFFLVQSGPGAIDISGSTNCLLSKVNKSTIVNILDAQTSTSESEYIHASISKAEYIISPYFSKTISTEFISLAFTVGLNPSLDKRIEKSTYLNVVSNENESKGNSLALTQVKDGSIVLSNVLLEKTANIIFTNHFYIYPKNSKIQVLVTVGSILV